MALVYGKLTLIGLASGLLAGLVGGGADAIIVPALMALNVTNNYKNKDIHLLYKISELFKRFRSARAEIFNNKTPIYSEFFAAIASFLAATFSTLPQH